MAVTALLDVIGAVRAVLVADATVAGLISTRVYGAEIPEEEAANMPRKAIVIRSAGSGPAGGSDYVEINELRLDLLHYGENAYQADRLRRAAYVVMKELSRKVQGGVLIHRANHSGGPIQLRDGDADWPLVIESWLVLAANITVA